MIPLVSPEVMADIDRSAQQDFRIPGLLLMEQAGVIGFRRCTETYPQRFTAGAHMVFVAGRGNNGGDALVMAREAAVQGFRNITAVMLPGQPNESAGVQLAICRAMDIPVLSWEREQDRAAEVLERCDVIFDGITGTGLKGPLRPDPAEAVRLINRSKAFCIAVDVPSGLHEKAASVDRIVTADCTVTMGLPKIPCYLPPLRGFCGKIIRVNPGFPPVLFERVDVKAYLLDEEVDCVLPAVSPTAYKTTRGHTAVFAGSRNYPGAARLAAGAASATRTGLVSFLGDDELTDRLTGVMDPSVVFGSSSAELPGRYTAVLCGPGWGRGNHRRQLLNRVIASGLPGVIDADGLHALADEPADLGGRFVLTPHPGEFSRLIKTTGDLLEDLKQAASAYQCWIVYKTHVVWIAGPDGALFAADGMNPALGTGGSGDVLAGIIAGLLAEGRTAAEAAVTGVLIHQRIGRTAYERFGWFASSRLIELISPELKAVTRE